jgi:hypothetical protein
LHKLILSKFSKKINQNRFSFDCKNKLNDLIVRVGQTVTAQYSADGKWYRAVVDAIQDGRILVRYVDFGNDIEWLPPAAIKM